MVPGLSPNARRELAYLSRVKGAMRPQAILTSHPRLDSGGCLCGWDERGEEHPGHQVAMLREAGVLVLAPVEAPALAQAILTSHQRLDSLSCLCGWSELGKPHAGHKVAKLREAGLLVEDEPGTTATATNPPQGA
jgi:hypothetical protein